MYVSMKHISVVFPSWLLIPPRLFHSERTGPTFKGRGRGFDQFAAILISQRIANLPGQSAAISRPRNKSPPQKKFQCAFSAQLISLARAPMAGALWSSCDYLRRHLSRYLLSCVVRPTMCRHWRGTNGANCERPRWPQNTFWSKLTVYPGIRQLQAPAEIKGNIWRVHLDLNNGEEMSKHIPTHRRGPIWQPSHLGLIQKPAL